MSAHKRESFHRTALTDERPQYDCALNVRLPRIGRVIWLHSVCEESLLNSFRHSDPRRLSSRAYLRDDAVHTLIVVVEDKPERGRCTNGYRFIAVDYRLELPLADGLLDGPSKDRVPFNSSDTGYVAGVRNPKRGDNFALNLFFTGLGRIGHICDCYGLQLVFRRLRE